MNAKTELLDLEIHIDGEWYAGVSSDPKTAWKEALHYARQALEVEKVEIYEVQRKLVYHRP